MKRRIKAAVASSHRRAILWMSLLGFAILFAGLFWKRARSEAGHTAVADLPHAMPWMAGPSAPVIDARHYSPALISVTFFQPEL